MKRQFTAQVLADWNEVVLFCGARSMVGILLVVSSTAGGVALGLPLPALAAALIAAAALAMFYESRNIFYYLAFAVFSLAVGTYLVYYHFYFLDIDLAGAIP